MRDLGFLKPSFSGRYPSNLEFDSTVVRISASFGDISNLHSTKKKSFYIATIKLRAIEVCYIL
jgi:hypothetical protein